MRPASNTAGRVVPAALCLLVLVAYADRASAQEAARVDTFAASVATMVARVTSWAPSAAGFVVARFPDSRGNDCALGSELSNALFTALNDQRRPTHLLGSSVRGMSSGGDEERFLDDVRTAMRDQTHTVLVVGQVDPIFRPGPTNRSHYQISLWVVDTALSGDPMTTITLPMPNDADVGRHGLCGLASTQADPVISRPVLARAVGGVEPPRVWSPGITPQSASSNEPGVLWTFGFTGVALTNEGGHSLRIFGGGAHGEWVFAESYPLRFAASVGGDVFYAAGGSGENYLSARLGIRGRGEMRFPGQPVWAYLLAEAGVGVASHGYTPNVEDASPQRDTDLTLFAGGGLFGSLPRTWHGLGGVIRWSREMGQGVDRLELVLELNVEVGRR